MGCSQCSTYDEPFFPLFVRSLYILLICPSIFSVFARLQSALVGISSFSSACSAWTCEVVLRFPPHSSYQSKPHVYHRLHPIFFCCWEADVDSQIHSLPFHALWRMMNTSKEGGMLMYFHQERCYQFPGSQRDDSPWWWWLTIDGFSSREDALQQSIKMFPVIR